MLLVVMVTLTLALIVLNSASSRLPRSRRIIACVSSSVPNFLYIIPPVSLLLCLVFSLPPFACLLAHLITH